MFAKQLYLQTPYKNSQHNNKYKGSTSTIIKDSNQNHKSRFKNKQKHMAQNY